MIPSDLWKNSPNTNLFGADLTDAALGRYDEPPWRLLRSVCLSVCRRERWSARRVVKDLCFRRRCGADLYSGTVWMPFPSIAFELEPGLGWDWWHTGAGRRMPEKKDNTRLSNHISNAPPPPHLTQASKEPSSLLEARLTDWLLFDLNSSMAGIPT